MFWEKNGKIPYHEESTLQEAVLNKVKKLDSLLKKTEAVIFDFDNVVVDSEPYHFKAYSRVFSRRGHHLDREKYWIEWTSRGGGAEGEIERHNLDMDPAEIRREKDPIYSGYCRSGEIKVFPAASEIVKSLARAGYKLAIASGSYRRDIMTIISANGIEELFSAVIGKDGIENTKPHPETYLKACRAIKTPCSRCLAIEDAEKGVKSATGAGMSVIVVETDITRGFSIQGAELKLSSIDQLRDMIIPLLNGEKS